MKYLFVWIMPLALLVSCNKNLKGEGALEEKELRLEHPIKKIKVEGNFAIQLVESPISKVVIEVQENLMDNVVINEEIGSISIAEEQSVSTDEIYKIYVYTNALESVDLYDNVQMEIAGELRTQELNVDLHDNAKWMSQVFIDNLQMDLADYSSASLKGTCTELEMEMTDHSQFISPDFITSKADIDIADNAQMNLQILSELEGKSTDNAVLEYRGNPNKDIKEQDQSKIIKAE